MIAALLGAVTVAACSAGPTVVGSATPGAPGPVASARPSNTTPTSARSPSTPPTSTTPTGVSEAAVDTSATVDPNAEGTALPADHPGPAVQQAMTQVHSVRAEGYFPFGRKELATDSVTVYQDGTITAREVWFESSEGGLIGYLGVDGQLYDKRLGRVDADRNSASWRTLNAPGVSSSDLLVATENVNLGGRMEAVDFLLAVPDPQMVETVTVDGRPITRYAGWAPIEAIYPGFNDSPDVSATSVAGWQVEIWIAADDGRPVQFRSEAMDRTGRAVGTAQETYVYDSPEDVVTAPSR